MCETALAQLGLVLHNEGQMMRSLRHAWFVLPLAALTAACSADERTPDDGGQTGAEQARCEADTTQPLAPEDVSPLGFSASSALSAANTARHQPLRYEDGSESALTLTFSQSGPARFEERSYHADESGIEIALGCDDAVVIPVTFTFATADGRFDENWELDYTVSTSGGSLFKELDLATLSGSYTLSIDTSSYERVDVYFTLQVLESTLSGALNAQAERQMGESVSAQNIPLATF